MPCGLSNRAAICDKGCKKARSVPSPLKETPSLLDQSISYGIARQTAHGGPAKSIMFDKHAHTKNILCCEYVSDSSPDGRHLYLFAPDELLKLSDHRPTTPIYPLLCNRDKHSIVLLSPYALLRQHSCKQSLSRQVPYSERHVFYSCHPKMQASRLPIQVKTPYNCKELFYPQRTSLPVDQFGQTKQPVSCILLT